MKLSENTETISFGSTMAGLGSVAGAYMLAMTIISPLVDGGGTGTKAKGSAQKVESVGQLSRMAGPTVVVRAGALCLSMYIGGRVQAWVACRGGAKASR